MNFGTISSWMNAKLEVRETTKHGKGVFAKQTINQLERLAIFGGDIMYIDEIKTTPKEFSNFALQIEERFVLGIRNQSQPESTDFFNHSCNPNAGIKGQIFLVAMRDIQIDEEIAFDYAMVISPSVGSDLVCRFECQCGAVQCRKEVTENDWELAELQQKYAGYFSEYLNEKIRSDSHNSVKIAAI